MLFVDIDGRASPVKRDALRDASHSRWQGSPGSPTSTTINILRLLHREKRRALVGAARSSVVGKTRESGSWPTTCARRCPAGRKLPKRGPGRGGRGSLSVKARAAVQCFITQGRRDPRKTTTNQGGPAPTPRPPGGFWGQGASKRPLGELIALQQTLRTVLVGPAPQCQLSSGMCGRTRQTSTGQQTTSFQFTHALRVSSVVPASLQASYSDRRRSRCGSSILNSPRGVDAQEEGEMCIM